jgi:hypothetical protein
LLAFDAVEDEMVIFGEAVAELGCMAMIKAVLIAEKRPDCDDLSVR